MIKLKLQVSPTLKDKFEKAINTDIDKLIEDTVKETVVDLKQVTPKDTGYASSRWDYYKSQELRFSFSLQNKFLIKLSKESVLYIENDAEYITYLNAGSSRQAPAFFVEQTIFKNGFVPTTII